MKFMAKQSYKYAQSGEITATQWLEKLWYLYSQKLNIINLLAERMQERELLGTLGKLLSRIDRNDHRVDLLIMQVRYFSDVGNLNTAEETAERLLGMIQVDTDKNTIRQAYEWRALIAREKTQTRQALQYYAEAERYADNDLSRAGIWMDKGLTLVYRNELQPAESLLRQAISVYEKYNSADILGDACNNLGICMIKQYRVPDAFEAYSAALKYYDKIGYKLGSAIVSGNITEIYCYHGNYDLAFKSAYDCLRLGTDAEDQISMSLSYEMLGRLHMDLGNFEKGAGFLKESIKTVEQVNDRAVLALNNSYLAQCYSRMGDFEKAQKHFDISLAISQELNDPELTARLDMARIHICRLCQPLEPALKMIEDYAIKYRKSLKKYDICRLLYEKTLLLSENGKYREAEKEFSALLANMPETTHKSFVLGIHALGYTIFSNLGDHQTASGHYRQAQSLLKEILENISDSSLRDCFVLKKDIRCITEQV